MESLVSIFHIDLGLFFSQVINFAIVFSILYFFAFKPLVANMAKRSGKIEESLKNAEDIENKMVSSKKECADIISDGKKQAKLIIEEASRRGEIKKEELILKAKEEVEALIVSEKEKLAVHKSETLRDIKKEATELVIAMTKKMLSDKVDSSKNEKIIKNSLS